MATRKRPQADNPARLKEGASGVRSVPAVRRDSEKHAGQPRNNRVSQSLQRYREDNPKPATRLANGLLRAGVRREVTTDDMEFPETVEVFTISEAAEALGKSDITLRRWISEDLIPDPVLRDTSRNYKHYSVGELRVISAVLAAHERDFVYYGAQHTYTKVRLEQAVHAYRARFI